MDHEHRCSPVKKKKNGAREEAKVAHIHTIKPTSVFRLALLLLGLGE